MGRELVVGIDMGTTSVKAVLFDTNGNFLHEAESLVKTYYPMKNWGEQEPEEVEQAARTAMKALMEKGNVKDGELVAVGFSAAMHSLVCVDENLQPLSRGMIWSDGRSHEQARELLRTVGSSIYLKTGTPIHPMNPFTKLVWMKETNYKPYLEATYFMTIKEYILAKWFGERVIDYSMASSLGLFNLYRFDWDEEALEVAGIRREQLSKIVPPTYVLPTIAKEVADDIGIPQSTPFVIGAADGQLANLGSGAISKGEVSISAGTSGAIRQFIEGFSISKSHDTFCYAFTRDMSIIGGPSNNGGIVLSWLKTLLGDEGSFEDFIALAEQVDIGSDGIVFLPYVNGERAPLWNQNAKGNFYGLSVTHGKEHLVRAVLEGIAFNLYQIAKALERMAGRPEKIYASGGLSRSKIWVQILADILGEKILLAETPQASAWGAAWVALNGIGKVKDMSAIKKYIHVEDVIEPDMNRHERYMKHYRIYENLVKDLSRYF